MSTALIAIWARTLLKLLAKLTTKPLFPSHDNLFDDDRLSGVIDFIEAANGAFLFDLGVVALT